LYDIDLEDRSDETLRNDAHGDTMPTSTAICNLAVEERVVGLVIGVGHHSFWSFGASEYGGV
jgi:hypothetical protein